MMDLFFKPRRMVPTWEMVGMVLNRTFAIIAIVVICVSAPIAFALADQGEMPFTVKDARTLPPEELGQRLIGSRVGRVVFVKRQEYDSGGRTPRQVDLFLAPKMPWPYIRNICSIDVVTVEYNWFDFDGAKDNDNLKVHHIEAKSRYLPTNVPVGDGDVDYNAIEASCSNLTNVERAFRAPDASDAQWLVAMHRQYTDIDQSAVVFPFECSDFEDRSCGKARLTLKGLRLENSVESLRIDCEMPQSKYQVNYCYKLTFPYPNSADPEWILKLYGGMSNGSAPVVIRHANLEHVRRPIVMY